MRKRFTTFIILLFSCLTISAQSTITTQFDNDWAFHLGGVQGAEAIKFDDSKWRKIDLPDDWTIEDLKATASPFDKSLFMRISFIVLPIF